MTEKDPKNFGELDQVEYNEYHTDRMAIRVDDIRALLQRKIDELKDQAANDDTPHSKLLDICYTAAYLELLGGGIL